MKLNWSSVRWGKSHFTKKERTVAVCSEEKESVESVKMTQAQATAGHQARSQAGISSSWRRGCISGSWGAGRGLRQGCSGKTRSSEEVAAIGTRGFQHRGRRGRGET